MFFKSKQKLKLSKLDIGEKFVLCRNGLKYKVIEHNFLRSRCRVKAIGHITGCLNHNGSLMPFPMTLYENSNVVRLDDAIGAKYYATKTK